MSLDNNLGCGFDPPGGGTPVGWYRVWRLKANSRAIELNASIGDLQNLILDANLPGRRAPNTYRNDMQLAYRGGRLTST